MKHYPMDLVHMKMGGAVYQIVKPGTAIPKWTEQLEKSDPCISNVSWQNHGVHAFAQKLRDMDVKECHDWFNNITYERSGLTTDSRMDAWYLTHGSSADSSLSSSKPSPNGSPANRRNNN